jgi:hypothetical protein
MAAGRCDFLGRLGEFCTTFYRQTFAVFIGAAADPIDRVLESDDGGGRLPQHL